MSSVHFIEASLEGGRGVHLDKLPDGHGSVGRGRKTELYLHCLQAASCACM